MAGSISDSGRNEDVDASVDSPGFRKALHRWLQDPGLSAAVPIKHLDPFSPQSPAITAFLEDSPRTARERFDACRQAGEAGVPTPHALAWSETGDGRAVYLMERLPQTRTMQEALLYHYYENPLCSKIIHLLQVCADAVRTMHQSGWTHGELTTEHLLLQEHAPGVWRRAWITRFHRTPTITGKPCPVLNRARDNALITLPSDLRRIFQEMQFAPDTVPEEFRKEEALQRARAKTPPLVLTQDRPPPPEQDIWIWDDRSMQAIPALKSRDKRKHYRKRDAGPILASSLRWGARLRRETAKIQDEAWSKPVDLDGKIGVSINLEPDRFEKELSWLEPLGPVPLLVRLYHHQTEANQAYALDAIRRLHAQGHRVTAALVQDRRAVLHPSVWERFVERVAGGCSGFASQIEVGHAINRVKWGFWNIPEYRQFLSPFRNWQDRYPQLPLIGPAGIDFEFPRVLPMLDQWPAGSLSAFSHHLYVDRRGAPENKQAGYDLERKAAMARAIARIHPACGERLVLSEVNWPLQGTGVWSPVGSPYQSPGERTGDPSVSEEAYADYLRRYLLISICSGLADEVYWWNLAAHGFGLVDDRDAAGWRPRPGYHAFRELVQAFRGSIFQKRSPEKQGWNYYFTREDEAFVLHSGNMGIESG